MSSHARSSREEERRLSIRTLIFASVGSAVAAILTSQFWIQGTPVAAAVTPVIVALVSELLHRPTERIAQRMTTETDALPEAAGAGPPPREEERRPRPAREAPGARPEPEYRVYRSSTSGSARPSRLPWKVILTTAAIAFAIAAAVLTLPELVTGGSLFDERDTTFFGGGRKDKGQPAEEQQTEPTQTQPDQTVPEESQPEQAAPAPQTAPQQTTPTPPPTTTPQPTQPRSPAPQAPVP